MNILSILQYIVLSLIFIISVHYSWSFLKTNLTVPKTKDLIKKPNDIYRDIYGTINKENNDSSMKNELKDYMNSLKNNDTKINNNDTFLSTASDNNNFFNWNDDNNENEEMTINLSSTIK
tara:strand:+ start:807 stop:1166 length:360 start_codon:yes stop_codon:yes gene_type:complete